MCDDCFVESYVAVLMNGYALADMLMALTDDLTGVCACACVRSSGWTFCDDCSSRRWLIATCDGGTASKPARVCEKCFARLVIAAGLPTQK